MPEMIKVADVMQQRYDASELYMEGLQTAMNGAKVLGKDQGLFNQRYGEYQKKLDEWSKRADLENIHKDVAKSGRAFANEYKEFSGNLAKAQAYQAELDDKVDKKLISRSTADQLLQMSHDQYKGLQYDPTTGRYSGQFSGASSANEIDPLAFTNKALEGFAASKNGTIRKTAAGDYFLKTAHSEERITAPQVRAILKSAMDSDNEFKSDLNQRMTLAQWGARHNTLEDLQGSDDMMKDAKEYMDRGYKENQAVAMAKGNAAGNRFINDIYGMGMKKVYSDVSDERSLDGLTVEGQKRANEKDQPFFLLPSEDFRLGEKDKDLGTLQEKKNAADGAIADIVHKIDSGNYTGDELANLRRQLITAKANKTSYESIISGAQEDAAKDMGYKSYADYQQTKMQPKQLESDYKEVMPSQYQDGLSLTDKDGKAVPVTRAFLIQAASNGRIAVKNDAWGSTVSVTGPDGKVYRSNNELVTKSLRMFSTGEAENGSFLGWRTRGDGEFTTKVKANIKNNAEKYAVKTVETPLIEGERTMLTQAILANPTSVNFYRKGESDPTKDLPANFDLSSIKIVKDGGKVWLTGYEKDKNGKPTGETYNVEVVPGSNIGDVIGKRLLMPTGNPAKLNQDPTMRAAGAVLLGGDMSGSIMRLGNNEALPITTSSGNVIGTVERKAYRTSPDGDSRYIIKDSKGNDISSSISEEFRKDPAKLATWIEDALLQSERKEMGKKN